MNKRRRRKKHRAPLRAFFLLLVVPLISVADEYTWGGSLSNRYKFRTTGEHHDHDLETFLSLNFGEPLVDKYSGSLQAGGIFDLDDRTRDSPFSDVYDTFDNSQVERLYHAYADAREMGPFQKVRLGRQHRYEFESLYYDGLTLQTESFEGLSLVAYGGIPVHLFENHFGSDPGDWLVGSAVQWDPVSILRFRADYVHLKDKFTGFRANVGDQEDDLIGASMWLDFSPSMMLRARFTSFTDQVRDLSMSFRHHQPEQNFTVNLRLYTLLKAYGVRTLDEDAFGFLGTYEPYIDGMVNASKGLGEHFAVDLGFAVRALKDHQISSAFNHGYERFFATLSTYDLLLEGLSLLATGDYYHGEDNVLKNNVFGGSFHAEKKLMEDQIRVSGGTAFYLYRFNLYTGNESQNAQTYYARVKGDIFKNLEGQFRYEFEHNDIDNFHTIDTRVVWKF